MKQAGPLGEEPAPFPSTSQNELEVTADLGLCLLCASERGTLWPFPDLHLLHQQMRGLGDMLSRIAFSSDFHDPIIYFMPRFPT